MIVNTGLKGIVLLIFVVGSSMYASDLTETNPQQKPSYVHYGNVILGGGISFFKDFFFRPQQEITSSILRGEVSGAWIVRSQKQALISQFSCSYQETNRLTVDDVVLRAGQRRILILPVLYDFTWQFPVRMLKSLHFGLGLSTAYTYRSWEESISTTQTTKIYTNEFQLGINYGARLYLWQGRLSPFLFHRITFTIIGHLHSNLEGSNYSQLRILALNSMFRLGLQIQLPDPFFIQLGYGNEIYVSNRYSSYSLGLNTTLLQVMDQLFIRGGVEW
jgi:hypothetical protein